MLFLLMGCLRITDEERAEWQSLYASEEQEEKNESYFSSDASISPATNIFVGTELICSATALDHNDEDVEISYRWVNDNDNENGDELGEGEVYTVLSEQVEVGDSISCVATIIGLEGQEISSQDTVLVENTEPTVSAVQISPEAPIYNDAILSCLAETEDPDRGETAVQYSWEKNGIQLEEGDSIDLSEHDILPDSTISCMVMVTDAHGGEDSDSVSVSVVNRSPVVDSILISDSSPKADETITCQGIASDEDGEEPELHYSWEIDGNTIATGLDLTLSPNFVDVGDNLDCVVTATDGFGGSNSSSETTIIENTNPTVTQVNITPNFTLNLNTSSLVCSAQGSDLDDGNLSPSYVWRTGGSQVGTGSSLQLSFSLVSPGDTVRCVAEVVDNNGASATSSVSITIPTIF